MPRNIFNSPAGMKSYLPGEAEEITAIKESIGHIFRLWGYRPIITPLLEYYDSLLAGMGQHTKKDFYKMIDYDGNILALRPEMTAPIARTINNRRDDVELPLRLFYFAPVYRYNMTQAGKNREIFQMGLEFIGENSLADSEVIIMAVEAIKNTGIENFKIDIGHSGYLEGIIRELGLGEGQATRLKTLLTTKDFVGVQKFCRECNQLNGDSEFLREFSLLRGESEVLDRARQLTGDNKAVAALEDLEKVYHRLADYGVDKYVNFDLSLNRGLDYYTGIVFEGFTGRLGYTICGGGRYDNLLGKYGGENTPAVGFAIGVNRISLALQKQEDYVVEEEIETSTIIFDKSSYRLALKIAGFLHKRGEAVSLQEYREGHAEISKITGKVISLVSPGADGGEKKMHKKVLRIIRPDSGDEETIIVEEGWRDKLWKVW